MTALLTFGLAVLDRVHLTESGGRADRRLDRPGIVLLAAGLSSLRAGLVESRGGWGQTVAVCCWR